MIKIIALLIPIITIIICGWLIIDRLRFLDIPINKNEWYAMEAKRKINDRKDIEECEKKILINQITEERKTKIYASGIAFQTQCIAFSIIIIQIILLILILIIPNKPRKKIANQ